MRRVCVFCGSSPGRGERYVQAAREVARCLLAGNMGLVFGGSNVGLMGVLADSVLDGGGEVIGVIPHGLVEKEVAHRGCSDLRIVRSMHERKALMVELADGFIALPGAFGTLDELCEVLTWAQLGIHSKPVGVLNVDGYFDALLQMLDHAVEEAFLRPENRALVLSAADPEALLAEMRNYRPLYVPKWITPAET